MTEILLVRHGLPVPASEPRHQPGLSDEGRGQASLLAEWLETWAVDAIVSSPLRRAQETAAPAAARLGLDVQVLSELREWERDGAPPVYVPLEDMAADDPRAQALAEGRFDDFVPAFDRDAFRRRAAEAMEEICGRWPDGRVVAVSHAGLINTMVAGVLGLDQIFWFLAGYTSISRLQRFSTGRTVVVSLNEAPHLQPVRTRG